MMLNQLKLFIEEDAGAVTVDWVVLTAGLVGLGALVIFTIATEVETSATSVGATIENMDVGYGTP